ncbi:MAG: formate dehydrogenase accessory sulfurtransferase FdhD, partial [Desulfamplus sp.]|nr:formate dehydrogenase accessory sulfurtransferase FdhD [Desulfamplus sp.]
NLRDMDLILEEPLSINIQGTTYSVIMRTPGDEKAHAAGFCLSEGVVDHPGDIAGIALCDGDDSNVAAVMLTPERLDKVSDLLGRKGFLSQTSCGICGREIIEDLSRILKRVPDKVEISLDQIRTVVHGMDGIQHLKKQSLASHASLIFNDKIELISFAEDAGRHNSLDKAVGKLFLGESLDQAAIALISSRASYEMVQKCARAGIEIVISLSVPTSLACELAETVGITLISIRKGIFYLFTGRDRILKL